MTAGALGAASTPVDKWLGSALDYIPQWLDYQMRHSEQPGCVIAIVHKGSTVFEQIGRAHV